MSQTANEFAHRLAQALDSCPTAPEAQYGRLSWLQRELKKATNTEVSVNTVHKWVNGMSLPRPDNIKAIARVLKVDEIWLALGRKPVAETEGDRTHASQTSGAALLVAGLIESGGGKVIFGSPGTVPHLKANISGKDISVIAVAPQVANGKAAFVIPEPVRDSRVVAIRQVAHVENDQCLCLQVVDLTDLPRQSLGGFSVLQLDIDAKGRLKLPGKRNALHAITAISDLAAA